MQELLALRGTTMRRSLVFAVLVLACSESLSPEYIIAPGHNLVGRWTSADTVWATGLVLVATPDSTTFSTGCWTARFGPVRLSDSLTFRETGVVTQAVGLTYLRVGDPYTIAGRALGDSLLLMQGVQRVLRLGSPRKIFCNA